MRVLFVIPARGGSKGIPGKNIKELGGKPLIHYSLEYARLFATDDDICVTTDSEAIAGSVKNINYHPPFIRPDKLATDTAGSYEVLQHAYSFYKQRGKEYDALVLLQPTSPFRQQFHLEEALKLFNSGVDMVVSVSESAANPYYNLFEENADGFLRVSKGKGSYTRRQDVPRVYEYNGSLYIINTKSLQEKPSFAAFDRVVKYVMDGSYSIDLDTPADWQYAEFTLSRSKN